MFSIPSDPFQEPPLLEDIMEKGIEDPNFVPRLQMIFHLLHLCEVQATALCQLLSTVNILNDEVPISLCLIAPDFPQPKQVHMGTKRLTKSKKTFFSYMQDCALYQDLLNFKRVFTHKLSFC